MGVARGANWGQILFLAESGDVAYQIEGIEKSIALVPILLKLGHDVIQDGRRKVKRSFFKLLLQTSSPPKPLGQ